MLPVNITEPLGDDAALYALELISMALSHPRCFVVSYLWVLLNLLTLLDPLQLQQLPCSINFIYLIMLILFLVVFLYLLKILIKILRPKLIH